MDLYLLASDWLAPLSHFCPKKLHRAPSRRTETLFLLSEMLCRRPLNATRLLSTRSCYPFNRTLATVINPPKLPFDATCSSVTPPYQKLVTNLKLVNRILNNEPLTLAEKILYSHLTNAEESLAAGKGNIRGQSYLKLNPDRVAMQGFWTFFLGLGGLTGIDASAQMAILQFMASGLDRTAVPTSIHCDHLIVGNKGAKSDLEVPNLSLLVTQF